MDPRLHILISSWVRRDPRILVLMALRPACILPCPLMVRWDHMVHHMALLMVLWGLIVLHPSWTASIQGKLFHLSSVTVR